MVQIADQAAGIADVTAAAVWAALAEDSPHVDEMVKRRVGLDVCRAVCFTGILHGAAAVADDAADVAMARNGCAVCSIADMRVAYGCAGDAADEMTARNAAAD